MFTIIMIMSFFPPFLLISYIFLVTTPCCGLNMIIYLFYDLLRSTDTAYYIQVHVKIDKAVQDSPSI